MRINETTFRILLLFSDNYWKKLMLNEIAKMLGINHRSAKLHVELLEELGVLSTERRGKFIFVSPKIQEPFKRFMVMAEYYKLIKDKRVETRKILNRFDGEFCIVFGSYASFRELDISDIDILCDKPFYSLDFLHKPQAFIFKSLKEVPDPLFSEVLKDHIIIKGAEKFIEEVIRRYGR